MYETCSMLYIRHRYTASTPHNITTPFRSTQTYAGETEHVAGVRNISGDRSL
ncbi:hypothetical protein Hanom_Chr12g01107831 [Helianthus anomalus]